MDWRRQILEHAAGLGRIHYESEFGVGVDFEDGCDAFWVLPGEVFSTVPVPAGGPAEVDALLTAYDRLARLRERALHVIRHYLASLNFRGGRHRGGRWQVEMDGGASTSISVGAGLTLVARDRGSVVAMVQAVFTGHWIKCPSPQRIQRYLDTPGEPPNEREPSDAGSQSHAGDGDEASAMQSKIRRILGLMGLCAALDNEANFASVRALADAAAPNGRIAQALLRMSERLSGVEATLDLFKPRVLSLDFDDGYATFDVDPRSKALARRIRVDGPIAVGDQLADEYLALNAARSRVLGAIARAAADRRWRKDEVGSGLFGFERTMYLGDRHREVGFALADPLSSLLRTLDGASALHRMFASRPDFADMCVAALDDPAASGLAGLPEGNLAPREVPAAPPLRELGPDVVRDMDAFARGAIEAYWTQARTIWEYRNPDVYDSATDAWAKESDWVRLAERHIGGEWPHPMAIVILLDAGDSRGVNLARQYVGRAFPHHEVSNAEVEIVWRFRHEFPKAAADWFVANPHDDVPFARARAALSDPIAQRYVAANRNDDDAENPRSIPPQKQEALHRDLLVWARTDHYCSPPSASKLRAAAEMGWRDVAEGLEENPYLLAGLLSTERRNGQFDEPGALLAGEFFLAWSRLAPGPFLARLLATVRSTDLLTLAETAAHRGAAGKRAVEKTLPSALAAYREWQAQLDPALGIAWTRCRAAVR